MNSGRWRISVTAPDWGTDHLSSDAIVAYVDDELAPGPHLRATQHLAQCPECAAQVVAQGQARAALRTADCPSLPSSLLSSLRSIPQDAELPAPPTGLSITPDGEFVSMLRQEPAPRQGGAARADVVAREAHGRRGLRVGTGVAVSGLAIGAIAFALPSTAGGPAVPEPVPVGDVRDSAVGPVSPVDARLQLPPAGEAKPAAGSVAPTPTPAPASAPTVEAESLDGLPGAVPGP